MSSPESDHTDYAPGQELARPAKAPRLEHDVRSTTPPDVGLEKALRASDACEGEASAGEEVGYLEDVRRMFVAAVKLDEHVQLEKDFAIADRGGDAPVLALDALGAALADGPPLHPDGGTGRGATVGPYTRQPSAAPYVVDDMLVTSSIQAALEAAHRALVRANESRPSLEAGALEQRRERAGHAARVALALADARLLGTPLFTTFGGRLRVRAMLASVRAAGTPHLARGAMEALVAALQQPPLRAWSAGDAEAMVDHATALLLCGTAEAPRTAHDLFALDWAMVQRLLGRVQLLGGEFGVAAGPLRPKALLFCAMAHDRFDSVQEAVGFYFEAWAELVRRQLTPGPLEAYLVPALADLHFAMGESRMGLHIAEKAYTLQGESEAALYSQYLVLHVRVMASRVRKEAGRALDASTEALSALDHLGADFALPAARMASIHAVNCVMAGKLRASSGALLRSLRTLAALKDPSFCDLDFIPHQLVRAARTRMPAAGRARYLFVVLAAAVQRADPAGETPMLAHIHFHRAETYREMGKGSAAAGQYGVALEIYRRRFPHAFPPDHPRVLHVLRALEELRPPPAAPAPGFLPRFFGKGARVAPEPPDADGHAAK